MTGITSGERFELMAHGWLDVTVGTDQLGYACSQETQYLFSNDQCEPNMSRTTKTTSSYASVAWLLVMSQHYSLEEAATTLGTTPRRVQHMLAGLLQRRAGQPSRQLHARHF
jgi:hypothetical protein